MELIAWEWMSFLLRWLHVIAAIAWIGSSFYFIHLDLSLRRRDGLPAGTVGEAWQVHGGGFYHMQKYAVAPAQMPEKLTWFKWEAYTTWLSGFALLVVFYYGSAELFLIDRGVADLTPAMAIGLSLAGIVLGWIAYDLMCKSPLGRNDAYLGAAVYGFLVLTAFGYAQAFSGRGAFMQVGAMAATMMAANVGHVIIPNQRKVVADLIAGRSPDPSLGKKAKQRSLHNNYLTLPVVFLMLGNHAPLAFGSPYAWVMVALVLPVGAAVRHFFNRRHAGYPSPWWTWIVAAIGMGMIIALSAVNTAEAAEPQPDRKADLAVVEEIVGTRCVMCHMAPPAWEGLAAPPKGVRLDSAEEIARHLPQIRLQAALSRAMPPGNLTDMTEEERAALRAATDWVLPGWRP
ncbi:urate hydroxylase PuuD [Indioceanicola profundi]|uniref:urate hydroxylase PuuD n=1 Tax=Indioceanicola profundi TaxID=2220096 RepID=UPI000E6AA8B3|nr:urate hydroxylase PuuD [Indioceanicola profundi]